MLDICLIQKKINAEEYGSVIEFIDSMDSAYLINNLDVYYIKLFSLRKLRRMSDARDFVQSLGLVDGSIKWLKEVRLCIDSIKYISWFEDIAQRWVDKFGGVEHKLFNLSMLYNQFGLKDISLELMIKRLDYLLSGSRSATKESQINNSNWACLAANALVDFHKVMRSLDTEFFLISGTLLGLYRENQILPHDYDLDIGVDSSLVNEKLISEICSGGGFTLLEGGYQNIFYCLKHNKTGIKIDFFSHYNFGNKYRHRTQYVAWDNTPFKLARTSFLGRVFFIPEDTERYLVENYGTWKARTPCYNTYLDTPNLVVLCKDDYLLQLVMVMTNSYLKNNDVMFFRAANKFRELTMDGSYSGFKW